MSTQIPYDEFLNVEAWARDPFLMLARHDVSRMTRAAVGEPEHPAFCAWLYELNADAQAGGRHAG